MLKFLKMFNKTTVVAVKVALFLTLFVTFYGYHCELFGAHGRHAKNIFYEESVRVPFLIKWGDRLPAGRNQTPVNTVDIAPTLLSMLGLPTPQEMQGEDLSDAVRSGAFRKNDCLLMGTGPTAIYGNGTEWRGIRSERFTYAVYKTGRQEFLFDNLQDPYQLHNLLRDPAFADTVNALRAEMYAKMDAVGDKFRWNSYYRRHWVKDRKILVTTGEEK